MNTWSPVPVYYFENEELISIIRKTMYFLQENSSLIKKYSDDYFEKIGRVDKYLKNISAIACYIDRLNKKRTAFKECWVEKIKQTKNHTTELHTTSLDICDVFSMKIQIEQRVLITNDIDLEIKEPDISIVWENQHSYMMKYLSRETLLCENDEKHLKQLLQDLGCFFITKGDDTHVAIIKAHIMKQLNK